MAADILVAIIAATDEASTAAQRGCIARLRRGRLLPREPNMIIVDTAAVLTREQPNRMKVAVYATPARRVGAAAGRGPLLR